MVNRGIILFCLVMTVAAFGAEDPQITFTATGGEGFPGREVASQILITTDTDLQGWSLGVRWDPAVVSRTAWADGAVLATVNGGAPADFVNTNDAPANGPGITQGVVISFVQTAALPPGDNYEAMVLTFSLDAVPDGENIVTEVAFADLELGEPPVAVTGVVEGASISPAVVNGVITILDMGDDCRIDTFTCESDPDNIFLTWTPLGCEGARPFDFLYLYREVVGSGETPELLEVWAADGLDELPTSYDDLGLEPLTYRYTLAWVYWPISGEPIMLDFVQCEETIIALTIDDVSPSEAFLPGVMWNAVADLDPVEVVITGRGFTTVEDTQVTIGGKPVMITSVTDDTEIRGTVPCSSEPGTFDLLLTNSRGEVLVEDAFSYGWMRGDVRIDGVLDLQDAIDLLGYLFFVPESAPLYCLDAADVNGDGVLNVADPVYLTYLLAGVDPLFYKPPEPFDSPQVSEGPLGCRLDGYDCENP